MRFAKYFISFFLVLAGGCISAQVMHPLGGATSLSFEVARAMFPEKYQELVHQIEIKHPVFGRSVCLGVSQVDPGKNELHSLIMTLEGLVLFEASYRQGVLTTVKSLPPFDTRAFAQGLMTDVSLILLPPLEMEQEMKTGMLPAKCWRRLDGGCEELLPLDGGGMLARLYLARLYDEDRTLIREAEFFSPKPGGPASRVKLRAFGLAAYTLELTLLQSEP